jgi:hypothetical protein
MMRAAAPLVLLACRVAGLGGASQIFKGRRITTLDAVKPPKSRRAYVPSMRAPVYDPYSDMMRRFAGAVGQATLGVSSLAAIGAARALFYRPPIDHRCASPNAASQARLRRWRRRVPRTRRRARR